MGIVCFAIVCILIKDGIRDMFGKKSRLEVKMKEEQSLREV